MTQDQSSGAVANQWGRQTAREIAKRIGAEMLSKSSNECTYKGKKNPGQRAIVSNILMRQRGKVQ